MGAASEEAAKAPKGLWFVLDMDEGVRGVFSSLSAAVRSRVGERGGGIVYRRHTYGNGSYEYVWHYSGDPDDGGQFFVQRGDRAVSEWDWAIEAWSAAGSPMEPFVLIDRPEH